jgi:4-amino-4-deoxy-L-arabinose transferase-like glycosyltransferase
VSWAIALSTALFGDSAAAVRLPSALAGAAIAYFAGRLAWDVTAGNGRAAWLAVLAVTLAPAYLAGAQLMTTDVFYSAGWIVAVWLQFRAVRTRATPGQRWAAWAGLGAVLGAAVLFKYTALFLVPGLALFLCIERKRLPPGVRVLRGAALAGATLLIFASPVLIWNAARGWPTVRHQLGRVALPGGDEDVSWRWSPLWCVEFTAAQIALLGGVGAVLVVLAWRQTRGRDVDPSQGDDTRLGIALLRYASLPVIGFYLVLSVFKQAEGNWAIAGYTNLLTLVGIALAAPRQGTHSPAASPGRSPWARRLWPWYVGVGVTVWAVLLLGPLTLALPGVREVPALRRVQRRVSGYAQKADAVAAVCQRLAGRDAHEPPLVISSSYQQASLLAFYMPGRPRTYSANSYLGARPNAYDYFPDTDLGDPALRGRDAVLVGSGRKKWQAALRFDSIDPAPGFDDVFIARRYGGVLRGRENGAPNAK